MSTFGFVATLFGVDFGSPSSPLDFHELAGLPGHEATDKVFHSLSGAFTHALLEWSAVAAALGVWLLCFASWRIRRDVTTPIIGVALLCAGLMDTFHTLAATRLMDATADNRDLIPFTWALSRVFDVGITVLGALICMWSRTKDVTKNARFLVVVSLAFGIAAYATIHLCAVSENLPQTTFPDAFITRPWDAVPLVMWLLAYGFVFRPFHQRFPGIFSHALLIAIIPQVATEAHMAFGSKALFDSHFNISHFLKIVAYMVPLGGLMAEYVETFRTERSQVRLLEVAEQGLIERAEKIELAMQEIIVRNEELDEFAHVASHDLQEPLRKLLSFSELLREDAGDELPEDAVDDINFITDAASRMSTLVSDLLALSRTAHADHEVSLDTLPAILSDVLGRLDHLIEENHCVVHVGDLPGVELDSLIVGQILQNLISNGIKFHEGATSEVWISADLTDGKVTVGVADNGIGISPEYRKMIFAPFKRLHSRTEYSGTGIGLAICKRGASRLGGEIWVESSDSGGSHFKFSVPCSPTLAKC